MEIEGPFILLMPIIFFHVLCAYVIAEIAAKKRRSTALWVIFGLVFGLLAVILAHCIPDREDE